MAGTSSHVSAGVWLLRATRPPWLRRITWNHLENHFTIQTLTLKKRSFKSHLLSACFHSQCFWGSPTRPKPIPNQPNGVIVWALLRLVRPAGGFRIEGSHLGPGREAERTARSSALERTNSAGESQVAGGTLW
jgi:hypothetical protein